MRDWYDIYLDEIKLKKDLKGYVNYKVSNKKKLIKLITKYCNNKKIMEAGCGTGIISTYISSLGYDVYEVDKNEKILELAKKISKEYLDNSKPKFIKKDILKLDYKDNEFGVIFSNGVLEHFNDNDIKTIIKLELRMADYVIVGIPTKFFDDKEALHGDERFLPLSHWRYLFYESGATIVEEASYHYMTFIEKILSIKKIFRPKPFRIFVLKKN